MNYFILGWVLWGIAFVGIEGYALYLNTKERKSESKKIRTLSSLIWTLGGTLPGTQPNFWTWIRRWGLGMFCLWLTIHFLSGGQIV